MRTNDYQRMERIRRAGMESWHLKLQEFADRCVFWIFGLHYPWGHNESYHISKNLGKTLTLTGDGFPMVRLRVLEGDRENCYRLLQYHFSKMDGSGKMASVSGKFLRGMQKYIWKQGWDADISDQQLRAFMELVGAIRYSLLEEAAEELKNGVPLPRRFYSSI